MELTEYIRLDMNTLFDGCVINPSLFTPNIASRMADDRLVKYAHLAMEEKLAMAREKGRAGWWDRACCPVDRLRGMLSEHVGKGDMRDVMILAAMIYVREIADAPEPAEDPLAVL